MSDPQWEPDDAICRDGRTVAQHAADPIPEPPAWHDELDLSARYLQPDPELEAS